MSSSVLTSSEFEKLLSLVEGLLSRTQESTRRIVGNVNLASRLLPASHASGMLQATSTFTILIERLLKLVGDHIASPGNPFALDATGEDWTDKVGAQVADLLAQLADGQRRVDDLWEGRAAKAYGDALADVGAALEMIKSATRDVSDALSGLKTGLTFFWVSVAGAISLFLSKLILSTVATSTVIAAPEGVAAAVAATIEVVGYCTALVFALVSLFEALVPQYDLLHQRLADIPGEPWPRTNLPIMQDSSALDGDPSEWKIQKP